MTDLNKRLDRITDDLATVEQLFKAGKLKRQGSKITAANVPMEQLVVETVYDDEASMVVIEHGQKGAWFPLHLHKNCIQFLICVRGKFAIRVPSDDILRVIKPKDCFKVDENSAHSVHCLEDDSKLIGVVVPAEPMYRTK